MICREPQGHSRNEAGVCYGVMEFQYHLFAVECCMIQLKELKMSLVLGDIHKKKLSNIVQSNAASKQTSESRH